MWTIDDILRNENFSGLGQQDLLEIISSLRQDLKYHKYRKDSAHEQLRTTIDAMRAEANAKNIELDRLKAVNDNFHRSLGRPLTLWERLSGRLDIGA